MNLVAVFTPALNFDVSASGMELDCMFSMTVCDKGKRECV